MVNFVVFAFLKMPIDTSMNIAWSEALKSMAKSNKIEKISPCLTAWTNTHKAYKIRSPKDNT